MPLKSASPTWPRYLMMCLSVVSSFALWTFFSWRNLNYTLQDFRPEPSGVFECTLASPDYVDRTLTVNWIDAKRQQTLSSQYLRGNIWSCFKYRLKSQEVVYLSLILYTDATGPRPKIWIDDSIIPVKLIVYQPLFLNSPNSKDTVGAGYWEYTFNGHTYSSRLITSSGPLLLAKNPLPIAW